MTINKLYGILSYYYRNVILSIIHRRKLICCVNRIKRDNSTVTSLLLYSLLI
nr:MAG TPA: hypothetical protein [Caudoviricetes sp.]